jgi:hypothetical protein
MSELNAHIEPYDALNELSVETNLRGAKVMSELNAHIERV